MNSSELLNAHAEALGHKAVELLQGDKTLDPVGIVLDGQDPDARETMGKIEGISAEAIAEGRVVEVVVRRGIALAILRELSPEAARAIDAKRKQYTIPLVAIGGDGVAVGRIEWGDARPAP